MSQTADQTQQVVQQALSRFEQLAASDDVPTQVLQQILATLVQTTASIGGVVWMPAGSGPQQTFRAVTRIGQASALAVQQDGSAPPPAAAIIRQASEQRKPIVVSPNSPEFTGTDLNNTAQFFVPAEAMARSFAVTQVIAPPDLDPKVYRQYAAFIQQGSRAAGAYLARRQTQVISDEAAGHATLLHAIHKLLLVPTPRDLIHEAATLAASLLKAPRVAVVGYWRKTSEVAFSNSIDVNRKAVLVRNIETLADLSRQRSAPMTFLKGHKLDDEDTAIEPLLDQLYQLGDSQAVCVTPIRGGEGEEKVIGVLVAEYNEPAAASREASVQQEFCRQAGPILSHRIVAHRRPLRRTSDLLARVRAKPLTAAGKTAAALAIVAAVVYALFLVPVDIVIRGNARLEPAHLAQVTAPIDGRIKAVHALTGRPVHAGDLLLEIDDADLRLALGEVNKSIKEKMAEIDAARARIKVDPKADSDLRQAVIMIEGLQIRRERLHKQIADTQVRAPIDGVVLTENPDRLMHMSVTEGTMLLRVADLSRFDLVTELREEDLAMVDETLRAGQTIPIGFLSHAWPEKPQTALLNNLLSLAPTSAPDEYQRQHVFKVTTPIELKGVSEQLALANPTGRAKLTTGKGSVAYRYARDLWRFIQMTLLF